ncbi:MAG: hypothetical protein ACYCVM_09665 [Acidiferrobacter sp.]
MTKHIFISDGDKGGVGKSVLASVICEARLAMKGRIALVEGDATQPDIALRYAGDPDVLSGILPLNRAGDASLAVSRFATWLETHNPDDVIINLPAGASETLNQQADLIRELADTLGYTLTCFYSLGKGDTPTAGLIKSLKSGVLSHVDPVGQIVVYPAFQGDPRDFVWYGHESRKAFKGKEIVLPFLDNRDAFKKMLSTPGRLQELAAKGAPDWMVIDRLNVGRWLKSAIAAVSTTFTEE